VLRTIRGQTEGTIKPNADGTYEVHGGALVHSKDAVNGLADGVDEWLRVRPSRFARPASGTIEVPIVVMTHHDDPSKRPTFRQAQNLRLEIVDAHGALVEQVNVSQAFGEFNSLHGGSLVIDDGGCHYVSQGSGFQGDINTVLSYFS
jgi:tellurium resistance protein TerD